MIADSVALPRRRGQARDLRRRALLRRLRRRPASTRCSALRAAVEAGAERVVLCDTNGGTLPTTVARVVARGRARRCRSVALGIHCHNDADCAVANSLVAVEAGATQVQGTMNGVGERTGNANLVSIIAGLQLKLGLDGARRPSGSRS